MAALLLTPTATQAAAGTGNIIQVDVAADGTPGDGYIGELDISNDGRYVAFTSSSSNLVPDDANGTYDVFVRDLRTGTTNLVSRGIGGQPADGYAADTKISGNGRYVAFASFASNLVADDTNGDQDVFVHDLRTGITTRVSVATGNVQLDGIQSGPSISDDGRYVTFIETDYLHGVGQEAFLHDRRTGVTRQITAPAGGAPAQTAAFEAVLSGNGERVAFSGTGDYTGDGGSTSAVYLSELATGATIRISPQSIGTDPADGRTPAIDRSGTKVLYTSNAALVPSDTNAGSDAYVHDLTAGTTVLVSANHAGSGSGNGETFEGALSNNGRYAGFFSLASDLVATDTNGELNDVFLRDLRRDRTTLVTRSASGDSGNDYSWGGIPSGDGSRVLFTSEATNLGVDPGDGRAHLFVRCLRRC
ncbi:Tol biopolymer transport system component [Actinoplanes campanulatus]|uniref:Tol biopolymer transport system component n=1 Tax=Actinoplanes campanulatus TaxID=113559 RepID=A0A7W5FDC7_9ACTN|nr:PD40 domain-containing protein [Actinoplanes campanulatus]MBB3094328.1 Tol biopolymer transport system component [Actinoplanes campanulatus]GGN20251.1 hypothetical protein GCM10010109_33960 [Actinoplanes campanulatus]GID35754.1 hypothetical protein Aca09nite_22600 [Actinoplanes campanulatus]